MPDSRRTLSRAACTAAVAVLMTGALLSPAHADSSTRVIDLPSTRSTADATFEWRGDATSTAGQFCVRVNTTDTVAGASIDTGDDRTTITFSATFKKPDCKYLSFPGGQSTATAYGTARIPGKESGFTGYYPITIG